MDANGPGPVWHRRYLAHALVMATVMGGLLVGTILPAWAAVRPLPSREDSPGDSSGLSGEPGAPVDANAGAPVETTAPVALPGIAGVAVDAPVTPRPAFDTRVERWRSLSTAASSTVQRV